MSVGYIICQNLLDLSDGPVVIEAPPEFLGIAQDAWFQWVTDMGSPGPDRGLGGKYLIVPPGYDGQLPDWGQAASKTVQMYCAELGCDYELITGNPIGKEFGPYAQKLHHLNEKYDKYDQVLMLDTDIIATKQYDNVFDVPQIGVLHDRAMQGPNAKKISLTYTGALGLHKLGAPCFFGNFIIKKQNTGFHSGIRIENTGWQRNNSH